MVSKLKEARLKAKYSIDDVSKNLKIRRQYIVDLEEGNFTNIPGTIYVRGYIKMYYKFLGIKMPDDKPPTPKKRKNKLLTQKFHNKYIILFSTIMLIIVVLVYTKLKSLHSSKEFSFAVNSLLENNPTNNTMDSNENYQTPDN